MDVLGSFIVGLFVGGFAGFLAAALMAVASQGDGSEWE